MTKYTLILPVLCIMGGVLVCTSCSNPKRSLGLNRTAPDEFTVISHAPLTLPPDYNLTPTSDTHPSIRKAAPSQVAHDSLFSSSSAKRDANVHDDGADILLEKIGASNADNSDIREVIAKEGAVLIEQDKEFTDKLVFWRDGPDDPTSFVVDSNKEAKRIQGNQALGKPINEGDTPYIARKKKSLLEF